LNKRSIKFLPKRR